MLYPWSTLTDGGLPWADKAGINPCQNQISANFKQITTSTFPERGMRQFNSHVLVSFVLRELCDVNKLFSL